MTNLSADNNACTVAVGSARAINTLAERQGALRANAVCHFTLELLHIIFALIWMVDELPKVASPQC
jgi:hypothetical protein